MPEPGGVFRGRTYSTAELMRLVVLVAANLALFEGVWWIVGFPPITMVTIVINLALHAAWVRRRGLTRPELVAALTGLVSVMAMGLYFAPFQPRMADHLLAALPKPAEDLILRLHSTGGAGRGARIRLDYNLLIGLGGLAMLLAGLLTRRFHGAGGRTGPAAGSPSP